MTAVPAPTGVARGRTTISARALDRVAAAVSADALGVDAREVSVSLTDHAGDLAIDVRSPIRILSLARVAADPHAVDRSGGTILERAAQAQERIGSRVGQLTGSTVGPVVVRLTAAIITPEERVR